MGSEQASPTYSSTIDKYRVFLSFRGKDTRKNFTDHLYTALVQARIYTFKDEHELERGKNIAYELRKAIEESRIAIIIFSKNYADSEWCLNELLGILERRKTSGLTILPVFYDVQPSDVRYQKGSFGEAFSVHKDSDIDSKVLKWKAALKEVSDLGGMVLQDESDGYESKFIREIVQHVSKNLNQRPTLVNYSRHNLNLNLNPIQQMERMLTRMVPDFFSCSSGIDEIYRCFFLLLFFIVTLGQVNLGQR